jgi:serine/threonine protein kinase
MIAGYPYEGLKVILIKKSDIWSVGIILFATLCGFLPFDDPDT